MKRALLSIPAVALLAGLFLSGCYASGRVEVNSAELGLLQAELYNIKKQLRGLRERIGELDGKAKEMGYNPTELEDISGRLVIIRDELAEKLKRLNGRLRKR